MSVGTPQPSSEYVRWLLSRSEYQSDVKAIGRRALDIARAEQAAGYYERPDPKEFVVQLSLSKTDKICVDHGEQRFFGGAEAGRLALSPVGTPCTYDARESSRFLILSLPTEIVHDSAVEANVPFLCDFGGLHHQIFDDPLICLLLRNLWNEAHIADGPSRLFADSSIQTIIATLIRKEHGELKTPSSNGGLSARVFARVEERIAEGLAEDLGLAELAAVAGLSPWHFARCFKSATGVTPATYVMQRRVKLACEMLAQTDASVTQIAFACGFSSSQHMATVFKRTLGVTPTAYRNAVLG